MCFSLCSWENRGTERVSPSPTVTRTPSKNKIQASRPASGGVPDPKQVRVRVAGYRHVLGGTLPQGLHLSPGAGPQSWVPGACQHRCGHVTLPVQAPATSDVDDRMGQRPLRWLLRDRATRLPVPPALWAPDVKVAVGRCAGREGSCAVPRWRAAGPPQQCGRGEKFQDLTDYVPRWLLPALGTQMGGQHGDICSGQGRHRTTRRRGIQGGDQTVDAYSRAGAHICTPPP